MIKCCLVVEWSSERWSTLPHGAIAYKSATQQAMPWNYMAAHKSF